MIKKTFKKLFSESNLPIKSTLNSDFLSSSLLKNPNISKLSENEIKSIEKIGGSFVLPNEYVQTLTESGLSQDNLNTNELVQNKKGLMYYYLRNMNLLNDYSDIFREFFQSVARDDFNYLNLTCEPFFCQTFEAKIKPLRLKGYKIELEKLKINQTFELQDWRLYKNLRINRFKNFLQSDEMSFNSYLKLDVFKFGSKDITIFDNNKPFILSTLMKVTTPMKLNIYNENLSLKLYGNDSNTNVSYMVKFETELSFSELFNGLVKNVNRGERKRQTRITDFNNILKGNPFNNPEIKSLMNQKDLQIQQNNLNRSV